MNTRVYSTETSNLIGKKVLLKGWINARRNMSKIVFLDLRDMKGLVQVVGVPAELDDASQEELKRVRPEWVVEIRGVVQERGAKQQNPDMPTGKVEVLAKKIKVLNGCKTPPFEIDKDTKVIGEELRLKYRYLDLRSERMTKNIRLRDKIIKFMRSHLHEEDFIEVETPILTKGTPEGAREYLVPSRLYPGNFYVLPQAPQQFKQLLMTSGYERYFQIARCFRDEDQRGDRQPEFTQLDLEMSFVEREEIMQTIEKMTVEMVEKITPGKDIQETPFPRFTHAEVVAKYGTDRPDLRKDKDNKDLLAFCWVVDFPFFEKTEAGGTSSFNSAEASWTFTHNPFSAALPEHQEALLKKKNIGKIIAAQYDIILNGYEIGGGSIRNHTPESLRAVLEIIGFDKEQIQSQFGHMLEAFEYGTPPHGGIALGLDRVVMILANEPNIREVIAFPKTSDARDLMMGAPSELSEQALKDANIKLR